MFITNQQNMEKVLYFIIFLHKLRGRSLSDRLNTHFNDVKKCDTFPASETHIKSLLITFFKS